MGMHSLGTSAKTSAAAGSYGAHVVYDGMTASSRVADDGLLTDFSSFGKQQCAGTVSMPGADLGSSEVEVVNSKNSGKMTVEAGAVKMTMDGRAYFADTCSDGLYSNADYKAVSLLGKTVSFTVDMGGAGCGCNVALYFV